MAPIMTIITRFPNLEVGCFAALLAEYLEFREALDVSDEFVWKVDSPYRILNVVLRNLDTSEKVAKFAVRQRENGIAYFNIGGPLSPLDQHGKGNDLCSLDRAFAYAMKHKKGSIRSVIDVLPVWRRISENDLRGTRISRDDWNLREVYNGVAALYQQRPVVALSWLRTAFIAIFRHYKAHSGEGSRAKDAYDHFSEVNVKAQVTQYLPPKIAEQFCLIFDAGKKRVEAEGQIAKRDLESVKCRWVKHPHLPFLKRGLRVGMVESDSFKIGPLSRSKDYNIDILIVRNSNGQSQILTRNIFEYGWVNGRRVVVAKYRIDLSVTAEAIRIEEAGFARKEFLPDTNLQETGMVLYKDRTICPWYLAEFLTAILNGSGGAKDVEPGKIHLPRLFKVVCETLFRCITMRRQNGVDDAEWLPYPYIESTDDDESE